MEKEKFVISVAEPWNFESIDGENIIKGIVLEILNDKFLIFKQIILLNLIKLLEMY